MVSLFLSRRRVRSHLWGLSSNCDASPHAHDKVGSEMQSGSSFRLCRHQLPSSRPHHHPRHHNTSIVRPHAGISDPAPRKSVPIVQSNNTQDLGYRIGERDPIRSWWRYIWLSGTLERRHNPGSTICHDGINASGLDGEIPKVLYGLH